MVDFNICHNSTTKLKDGVGTKRTTVFQQKVGDKSLWTVVEEYDRNGDEKYEETLTKVYDENKKLINKFLRRFEFNQQGQITHESFDKNADGTIEKNTYNEYDEEGRIIHKSIDENGDDIIDCDTYYEYDEEGKRTETIVLRNDDIVLNDDSDKDSVKKHPMDFGL